MNQHLHSRISSVAILVILMLQLSAGIADDVKTDDLFDRSLEELLKVKVSSVTKTKVPLNEAPAVVSVVTSEDIENYDIQSLADVFKILPGFDVLNDLSTYNAGVRGINAGLNGQSQVLKVMLDGQDMAFRPTTGNFIGPEFIPMIAVDRIEVIRGPLSALYGANAFLGTVNVIPKTMSNQDSVRGVLDIGFVDDFGNSGYQAQFGLGDNVGDFSFYTALSIDERDRSGLKLPESSPRYQSFVSADRIFSENDRESTQSFYFRGDYKESKLGTINFNFLHQLFNRSGNFQADSEPLLSAEVGYQNTMAHIRVAKPINNEMTLIGNFSVNWGKPSDEIRQYDPFRSGIDYAYRKYQSRQYTSSLESQYQFTESLNIIFGVDYSFDQEDLPSLVLVDENEREFLNDDRYLEIDNKGAYVQVSWSPFVNWQFIGGLRTDDHSIYESQTTHRFGLVYSIDNKWTLKLLQGSSFKAPSTMLMFGGQHPRFLGPLPNSNLAPQSATTKEVNLGVTITPNFRISTTLYNTQVNDFAEYDTLAANPQAKNRGEIVANGLEFEARYRNPVSSLDAYAYYSYVDTKVSTDTTVGIQVSEQTRLYPRNMFSLGSHLSLNDSLKAYLQWNYIDERQADKSNLAFLPFGEQEEYQLDAYSLINLGVDIYNTQWLPGTESRLRFSIKNFFEEHYTEPGFVGIDVPGLKRQFYVTYRLRF
ncbi:TonB-dependent receptor plug domain-containing protein [Pleionea sediminis]|uniref:TonB-dependent receptor plug domain-containing protein n=1 Tax=Pleionea sediminis TaxID=2569479 RepID=UPI00118500CF|nr:TonB-dependent receptor [Pleionea sediminis]